MNCNPKISNLTKSLDCYKELNRPEFECVNHSVFFCKLLRRKVYSKVQSVIICNCIQTAFLRSVASEKDQLKMEQPISETSKTLDSSKLVTGLTLRYTCIVLPDCSKLVFGETAKSNEEVCCICFVLCRIECIHKLLRQ